MTGDEFREWMLARRDIDARPRATAGRRRHLGVFALLLFLLVLAALLAPLVGATHIDLFDALKTPDPDEINISREILFTVRLPRLLFGLIVGASLSLAGCVYQAILRNDLAEPYTLGVAGSAAVGALLVFRFAPASLGAWMVPVSAFAFVLATLVIVYTLSRFRGGRSSPSTLILAGVTLNFLFGAMILMIEYLSDPYQTTQIIRWLMGGLQASTYRLIAAATVLLLGGAAFLYSQANALNALALGDLSAHHLGVSVERTRVSTLLVASLLAAFVVAYAGPIGFVGLIVPHTMRRLVGADHRVLLPASLLAGAAFLVFCDAAARSVLRSEELPVGIITAFLGAPFFLWLIFRRPK